jgi:hypothetical protein
MKDLQIILESLTSDYCRKKLKKLIELNPNIDSTWAYAGGNDWATYDMINSDGELVCILPFGKKAAISDQVRFWRSILMMVDNSKLY